MATSRVLGNPMAIAIMLLGLVLSIICAVPLMQISSVLLSKLSELVTLLLNAVNAPEMIISLVCDAVISATTFAFMMSSFIFGVSLVFGFIEEVGYMARISYVFDGTMAKLGLLGKAVMPFIVSFGCNIGGVSGTRVIDNWGQRVLTMSLSWVVPCASTWGVIGLMTSIFFRKSAIWVFLSLFLAAILHLAITSKVFGRSLVKKEEKRGLIMELPPYHKPRYKNLFRFVFIRMGDVLKRAMKIIILVFVFFWLLSYTSDGNIEHSIIYKIGTAIEPVTMWFGFRWQLFMAYVSSGIGKEASLGVMAALFGFSSNTSGIWGAIAGSKTAEVDTAVLASALALNVTKAEALAFIYGFFFNVPCIQAIVATVQESRSAKWTLRIVGYYVVISLIMAMLAYHIGLLIF